MSVPAETIPLISALIVGVANFVSILLAYYRMERRVDKKIDTYWNKFKKSEEGKAFLEILEGTRQMVKTSEASELLNEATGAFKEIRTIMKKFAERMEAPLEEGEEEEEDVLPTLKKKKKAQP